MKKLGMKEATRDEEKWKENEKLMEEGKTDEEALGCALFDF